MSEEEKSFFGIEEDSPIANTKFENPMYNKGCSSRIDENGKGRTTYSTFKKVDDGIWEYCGDCFRGENYMHGKDIPYVR